MRAIPCCAKPRGGSATGCGRPTSWPGSAATRLLTEPLRLEHASNHAQLLVEHLHQLFDHRGRTLACRASLGLAGYPGHHRDAPEMLKAADMALHRAKMPRAN